mgnify:CR=1 FL=1
MSSENTPALHPHDLSDESSAAPPCVLIFNANDPSGAGGMGADVLASDSVGAHALPVVTGAYMRDTAEIFDHVSFDEEAVAEGVPVVAPRIRGAVAVRLVDFSHGVITPDDAGGGRAADFRHQVRVAAGEDRHRRQRQHGRTRHGKPRPGQRHARPPAASWHEAAAQPQPAMLQPPLLAWQVASHVLSGTLR